LVERVSRAEPASTSAGNALASPALDNGGVRRHNPPLVSPPLQSFAQDALCCLQFYSRLPVGSAAAPDFRRALRALPVAGAAIGGCGALVLVLAHGFRLAPLPAAACAVAALVGASGALHEDGLADVADGFGGGATRERKLEIMRDSRLGSYGAIALVLALMLRVFATAALLERGLWPAAAALIFAGAASRVAGLAPLLLLPPARPGGLGAAMGRPAPEAVRTAAALTLAGSAIVLPGGAHMSQLVGAQIGAILASVIVTKLAERQIGGYTGDVLGAAQQAAEIAVLLALCGG
jgi:adenosylcobinamide-GDP ribazoletransferase